ncbi:MAG TPA: hypothetical protein VHN14_01170 [Kofleriaceae bacterium]|nr:hypothetical protein [Kofleriaceae bacterium]
MACALLIAAAIPAVPGTARAEPSPTDVKLAEELAQQAFDAYTKGDFAPAVALYKKAYQTSPSAVILFNIANIYDKKLKDKDQALDYYRRYLHSGETEPDLVKRASDRIDIIRVEIEATKQTQSQSEDHPPSPSPPPLRSPSSSPSRSPAMSPQNSTVPPVPPASRSGWRTAGLVTGAVGVVGLGIGGVYGFIAKSKNDQASDICNGNACVDQRGVTLTDEAHRAALVSTVSFIVGGAIVAGGIGLYLYAPRQENRMNKIGIRITPQLGPQLGGLAISGTWQ